MNKLVLVAVLLGAVACCAAPLTSNQYEFLFTKFMTHYGKQYHHDNFFTRFNIFKANLDKIRAHNEGSHSFTMGVNAFADMTTEEFAAMKGLKVNPNRQRTVAALPSVTVPSSWDWVSQGKVTGVKNQGQCGSCWSFSTTGSIEGAYAIAKNLTSKTIISLSEQQLVDCSGSYGNEGCSGGSMDAAFQYVMAHGLCTEAAYPYTAEDGTCESSKCTEAVKISSYKDVTAYDESALLTAAAIGPVSVAIEADQSVFQFYSGGVITSGCGTSLDHGVLVVGWGTDSTSGAYWKVKNSWGASWGLEGYVMIGRGNNVCGISMDPSYPIV